MHHPNFVRRTVLGSLLLGLLIGSTVCAQAPAKGPAPKDGSAAPQSLGLIVPIGGTKTVQMSTKRNIANAENPRPTVARIQPAAGDPTSVLITGLEAGSAQIALTDDRGTREVIEVIVQFDVEYLRTLLQRTLPTSNIQPIPGANSTVILTGTIERQEDAEVVLRVAATVTGSVERVVNALRVGGVMQVQLDVSVARVARSKLRLMSFDFLNFGRHHVFGSTVGGGFVIPNTGMGITGNLPGAATIPNIVGSPNGAPSNLFLAVFNPEQDFFGLLQALKTENVVKIMSKPSLVSLSGQRASFLDGGEQAIPVPAGLGQVGVQFEEFGTRLNFLPIVLGNGKIHLEVEPEISSLDPAFGTTINGTTVPGRATQRIHTTVRLEDGQTYVLGGLIQHRVTGETTKVPIVGEIPFLGAAFSRKTFRDEEDELVILVTPHLIDAMSCDQAPKLLPGQETRSPDDFELFLEGILEAPRGPREVCPDHRYQPAYKNGPTSAQYPCGDNGRCVSPGCGTAATGCTSTMGVSYVPIAPGGMDQPPLSTAATATPNAAPLNNSKPTTLPPLEVSGTSGREGQK